MNTHRAEGFAATALAVAVCDGDGRVKEANAAFLGLAHRNRDEIVGRVWHEVFGCADAPAPGSPCVSRECVLRGNVRRLRLLVSARMGDRILVAAEEDVDEAVSGERRVPEAPTAAGTTHRPALGALEWDLTAGRITCSQALADILGVAPSDVTEMDALLRFVDPADTQPVLDAIARVLRDGETTSIEMGMLRSMGMLSGASPDDVRMRRDVRCILHASHDALRDPVRLTAVFEDLTEERDAARQSREQVTRVEADRRMETVGLLAGGVAHDFNNLLTVIVGLAELLNRELPEGPQRADVQEIIVTGRKASEVTSRLLAIGRRQVLQPRLIDVQTLLSESREMLRHLVGDSVEIAIDASHVSLRICADLVQIRQVLVNLASNARDAIAPAAGRIKLEASDAEVGPDEAALKGVLPGRFVRLRVIDDGKGMSAETMTRAFEPFFTTKQGGSSNGLGLATVYGIVRQSGGHVGLKSGVGQGTTVELLLPSELDAALRRPPVKVALTQNRLARSS